MGRLRAKEAGARIRALALVGGPHALEVMAHFSTIKSLQGPHEDTFVNDVTNAIKFAWPRVDRHAFAAAMFGPHEKIVMWEGDHYPAWRDSTPPS